MTLGVPYSEIGGPDWTVRIHSIQELVNGCKAVLRDSRRYTNVGVRCILSEKLWDSQSQKKVKEKKIKDRIIIIIIILSNVHNIHMEKALRPLA